MGEAMEGTGQMKLLLVDDEPGVLSALQRALRGEGYDIMTASGGSAALDIIIGSGADIVVSDYNMPGMDGLEFLRKVRETSPESMRVMLTASPHMKTATDAINQGQVCRFITKPWENEELRITLRQVCENLRLSREVESLNWKVARKNEDLRELNDGLGRMVLDRTAELEKKATELEKLYGELEEGLVSSVRSFLGLLELKDPWLGGHSKRVAAIAKTLCPRLGIEGKDVLDLECAALLHDVGLVGVPNQLIQKQEATMTSGELRLFRQHSQLGQAALSDIPRLRTASQFIRSHHESFDGRGYPDGLRGRAIPLGARVIAVAEDFDTLLGLRVEQQSRPEKVLEAMSCMVGTRYDPEVFYPLLDAMSGGGPAVGTVELATTVGGLKEGQVLARDLRTGKGVFLAPMGTELTSVMIDKIRNFDSIDPVVERVFVKQ